MGVLARCLLKPEGNDEVGSTQGLGTKFRFVSQVDLSTPDLPGESQAVAARDREAGGSWCGREARS